MTYLVKEIFYTLQGEGAHTGRPAVFCRFAGCNLWTGREEHRASAVCQFCDTDFVGTDGPGGGKFRDRRRAGRRRRRRLAGGRPGRRLRGLHRRRAAAAARRRAGRRAARRAASRSRSRPTAPGRLPAGHRLGLRQPQGRRRRSCSTGRRAEAGLPAGEPEARARAVRRLRLRACFLQPMDGPDRAANTAAAVAYCLAHPEWRLSRADPQVPRHPLAPQSRPRARSPTRSAHRVR